MWQRRGLWKIVLAAILFLGATGVAVAAQQAPLTFNPTGGSGVTGGGTLTAQGSTTLLMIEVKGFPSNTVHPIHVHTGTCANPGPPIIPIPSLEADAQGLAGVIVTLDVPLSSLQDGNHLVMTHVGPPPQIGSPVACADIASIAMPAALPKTGEPSPSLMVLGLGGIAFLAVLGGGLVRRRGTLRS